jgi:hypothetical protein
MSSNLCCAPDRTSSPIYIEPPPTGCSLETELPTQELDRAHRRGGLPQPKPTREEENAPVNRSKLNGKIPHYFIKIMPLI